MWIVAKIKNNNFNIFSQNLSEKLKGVSFYFPKIKEKDLNKNLLGNYVFCNHKLFSDRNFKLSLNYTKGLEYFLNYDFTNQKEIIKFISYCKYHEDQNGFIKNSFFKEKLIKNGKFICGPFINNLFKVLKIEKNKLFVQIGNLRVNISDNEKALYQPS
tara:strand:- start:516 stop:989 length:474 start_codon:yes stop_codon:yes gene_type:complete